MRSVFIYLFAPLIWILYIGLCMVAAGNGITFWTTEDQTERLAAQKHIARLFAAKTGISVNVVPVSENNISDITTKCKTTGALPDVVYHPMKFSNDWARAGVLDVQTTTTVIRRLGEETFCTGALRHVAISGGYSAVPIDGWHQLLLYRKDLFKANHLSIPNSWDRILRAARTLHNAPMIWGIMLATDPNQLYTQQVFEHFALSNGARLVDSSGRVNLNTPEMVETLTFYRDLNQYSPGGNINWWDTRKAYVSGRTAMILWSPYILDELSGLRKDLPVIPDITTGEMGYLARNTGFVSSIRGFNGVAQYSHLNGLGISKNADKRPSERWVEFLLTNGYLEWLDIAPEGKMPMRLGTRHETDYFLNGWMELEFGVNIRAKISKFFGKDVLETIINTTDDGSNQWGLKTNKEDVIAKIYATKVIPKILKRFLDGQLSAEETARLMNDQVNKLQ